MYVFFSFFHGFGLFGGGEERGGEGVRGGVVCVTFADEVFLGVGADDRGH